MENTEYRKKSQGWTNNLDIANNKIHNKGVDFILCGTCINSHLSSTATTIKIVPSRRVPVGPYGMQ